MGADSFIRRASGLLLPTMSMVAPWRFLPCESCCESCDCPSCSGVVPFSISVVIAGVTTITPVEDCADCDDINGTYICVCDPDFFGDSCNWIFNRPSTICAADKVRVELGTGPGPLNGYNRDGIAQWRILTGDVDFDCASWSSLSLPLFGATIRNGCDYSSATFTITSL